MLSMLATKIEKFFHDPGAMLQKSIDDSFSLAHLSDVLFFDSYDEETKIFSNATSDGFVFEISPLVGGDQKDFVEDVAALFSDLLPIGSSLQTLLWADHRVGNFLQSWMHSVSSEEGKRLASERARYLLERGEVKFFRCIISFSIPKEKNFGDFKKIRDIVEQTFNGISELRYFSADELIALLKGFLSHPSGAEVMPAKWDRSESIATQIFSGNTLEVEDSHLCFRRSGKKDVHFQAFSAAEWPDSWDVRQVSELIGSLQKEIHQISCPFFVSHAITLVEQSKISLKHAAREKIIEKQALIPWLRYKSPGLEKEFEDCGKVAKLKAEGERWTHTALVVGLFSTKGEEEKNSQALQNFYRSLGIRLSEARWLHLPILLSSLPMGWGELSADLKNMRISKLSMSSEAAYFMPIQAEWQGVREHGSLLKGRRGQLLSWDPFGKNSGNYNCVVTGVPGSGKSVFLQDIMYNGFIRGRRVFALEVGRSFSSLCDLLGGTHIAFDGRPICLNPWPIVAKSNLKDVMLSLVDNIIATMCVTKREITDFETAQISKAVRSIWKRFAASAKMDDVRDWFIENEMHEFASIISMYCSNGKYAEYFTGSETTDLSNHFVVIELEELRDKRDLRAVALQLSIATIANEIFLGDRQTKSYICIDEAWDLMRDGQMGPFIETLARRLRKYGGALIIGTQSVGDFQDNKKMAAAYKFFDWSCYLSQKEEEIESLGRNGVLTENLQAAISSLRKRRHYREILIRESGAGFSICKLELDPFSRLLYSSKAEDFAAIQSYKKRGLSSEQAIQAVLKDRS